jgi:hypothetical protein
MVNFQHQQNQVRLRSVAATSVGVSIALVATSMAPTITFPEQAQLNQTDLQNHDILMKQCQR